MAADPGRRATWEAAKYRRRLREAEQVIAEQQTILVRVALAGRLADPADFDRFVGRENVTDRTGRIDYGELEVRLRDLLTRRPYLAAGPVGGEA